ncbi:MAG: cyclic nucleotide-binding domain-containing protein [Chloroflexi bacterium]|nr:cyclic nucleotide-binding domain-containing protein [Chloroflexota bacterium]MCI0578379.1 cyclic nucleotide-binding domain-containing protein [Chloroflexota bacterium]MCI0645395.1 cyclic nucleotide-binding domain-containing protein [Chloroflexota bacterium]MCI0725812.1 cyclic nucleotide-binding domain-containing protein [Chloroflexota bacterium]
MDPNHQSLRQIPLFSNLSEEVIRELGQKLLHRHIQEGEILFRKGDTGDSLYIIESGWVKAVAGNIHGEEVLLNQFGPGESFGEMSLVDGRPRSATIVALTALEALQLKRDDFLDVLIEQPEFALELLRDISGKLRFAANYIQKVTEWSQYIAEGNYMHALDEIESAQITAAEEGDEGEEERTRAFLESLFKMIHHIKAREEDLERQVQQLRIKIDEGRRANDVAEITETEYFQELQRRAKAMRQGGRGPKGGSTD